MTYAISTELRPGARLPVLAKGELVGNKLGSRSITYDKGKHKCEYCEKSFPIKGSLLRHALTHTGEKLYECKSCPSKFSHKYSLVLHTRIHTGEKPYKCEYCEKQFSRTSLLRTHTRVHTDEKPFECQFCDYSATQKNNLVTHERTHTGEKPFKCQFCSFATTHKTNLKRHGKVHAVGAQTTRTKRYKCALCSKVYHYPEALNNHKETHTREKRHECKFCNYEEIQRGNVVKHKWKRGTAAGEKPYQKLLSRTTTRTPNAKEHVVGNQQDVNLHLSNRRSSESLALSLCRICEFSCSAAADMAFHLNAVHSLPVLGICRLTGISI